MFAVGRAFALTVLLSGCAGASPPAGKLPLGLESLRWGMTKAEAESRYRLLAPQTALPPGTPASDQAGTRIAPYRWKGCTFEIFFYFGGAHPDLDDIELFQLAGESQPCAAQARADLIARYGPADGTGNAITGVNDWLTWLSDGAKYDRAHPEEAAKRYAGLSAMERFQARAKTPGATARFMFLHGSLGVRVLLFSPDGPGRTIFN